MFLHVLLALSTEGCMKENLSRVGWQDVGETYQDLITIMIFMSLSFSEARTTEIQYLDSPVMLTKNNPIWAENIPNDKPWLIKKQKKKKSLCYWIFLLEPNSILRGLYISRAHHAGSLKWPDYNSLLSCALIRVF